MGLIQQRRGVGDGLKAGLCWICDQMLQPNISVSGLQWRARTKIGRHLNKKSLKQAFIPILMNKATTIR
jgi:hypothetical protein